MTNNAQGYNNPPPNYESFGVPDNAPTAQNPSILPSWWPVLGGEAFDFVSVQSFLAQNPRLPASCIGTLGGSVTTGDTVGAALSNPILPGGAVVVTTQASGADTLTTLAARLALLLTQNATLQSYGILFSTTGATITAYWPGPLGNLSTLSLWSYVQEETATIGGTVTTADVVSLNFGNLGAANTAVLTIGGTKLTGDVLTVTFQNPTLSNGVQTVTYTVLSGDTLSSIATGIQTAIAAASPLAPLTLTSNASGTAVNMAWNGAIGTVYVSASFARAATETVSVASQAGTAPSPLAPSPAPSDLLTVGGTVTTGDVITMKFYSPQLQSPIYLSYTTVGGDTTSTIATALAALINGNATLTGNGSTIATVSTNAVTVTWVAYLLGPLGVTVTIKGVATETATVAEAPATISAAYTTAGGDSTTNVATGLKNAINANSALVALGFSATSSSAVVSIFYSQGAPTFASTVSGSATETVTFAEADTTATLTAGGTIHTGDVLTTTFATAFGSFAVPYTVTSGDTTTTLLATHIAAAINADTQLAQFGIVATSSSAVVSVTWNASAGAMGITTAVTGTANTTTLTVGGSTHSTETATYSNSGGALAGGAGPIVPTANFQYSASDVFGGFYCNFFRQGNPYLVDYSTLSAMVTGQLPII